MKTLYECYSRLLIDNHISELKPEYMSRFDPAEYVRMVELAGVEAAMVYACDHNGNCYYRTRTGHMHAGLKGRDIFGETVSLLRKHGKVPVAYYTVIYHNESVLTHPEWAARAIDGYDHRGRYRYSCPNNPEYRAFCCAQLRELMNYPLGGVFIDMTFWPLICQCDSCRSKFGGEIPTVLDWRSLEWVRFQRWRESSLAEFAAELTGQIKELRPEMPVTHQFSPVLHGWLLGQSYGVADACDYASGDFYGGKLQQRFGAKAFAAFTRHPPYEFMTSRCADLHDHTSTKSPDELFLHAVSTLLNGGAYFFIDAINPDGTLEEKFYRQLRGIVKKLEPFRRMIAKHRPTLQAEVGIYFSMSSCVDPTLNGIKLADLGEKGANNMALRHNLIVDEMLGTSLILNKLHVPYTILNDHATDFSGLKTIIINRAAYLGADEADRLRQFVKNGGTLIATGETSLYDTDGNSSGNFQLADVFGVDYTGKDAGAVSYLKTGGEYVSANTVSPLVTARFDAKVKGTVNLPDFPCNDPVQYASIHSNPPGFDTAFAGLAEHRYGKGKCVYLYSGVLARQEYSPQKFGLELLRKYTPPFVTASRNLPDSAEITLLRSRDGQTDLLGIVNYQEELPNIPLIDLEISVRVPEPRNMHDIPANYRNGLLTLNIERLDHAALFELIY